MMRLWEMWVLGATGVAIPAQVAPERADANSDRREA
jgi:hypothetical protein